MRPENHFFFVGAQPLGTGSGQSTDLRGTQHTKKKKEKEKKKACPHLLFNVLCLSDGNVMLV